MIEPGRGRRAIRTAGRVLAPSPARPASNGVHKRPPRAGPPRRPARQHDIASYYAYDAPHALPHGGAASHAVRASAGTDPVQPACPSGRFRTTAEQRVWIGR